MSEPKARHEPTIISPIGTKPIIIHNATSIGPLLNSDPREDTVIERPEYVHWSIPLIRASTKGHNEVQARLTCWKLMLGIANYPSI